MTDADRDRNGAEPAGQIHVLAASVLTLLIGSGAMFLVVVALKPIAAEFSWPRAVPSLAFSLQFLGAGFGGFLMGRVLDRFGMGPPAMVAAITIPCGAMLLSQFEAAWQLYAIYGVLIGFLGTGALAAPAMANIARWYIRRRGMAVGLVAGGQALAGIMWPPIFVMVMEAHGWRTMAFAYGAVAAVFLPVLALILRRRPEIPRGAQGAAAPARGARRLVGPGSPVSVRALQAALCAAIVGCCVAMGLPLGHLVSYVTDLGHPASNAAEVLSLMLMSAFVSRAVFVGLLADNIGGLRALFIFSGGQAAMLAAFTMVDGLAALYAVAILFGLGYGGIFPVYAVAIRELMPVTEAGRRTGLVFLFGALAMGFGSWIGGVLFDMTGTYVSAFLLGVAFNVANLVVLAVLIFRIGPRRMLPAAA